MRNSLSKMHHLLLVLLLFALAGCGANRSSTTANQDPGQVTAKVAPAKTLAAPAPDSIIRLIVSGNGIPTASKDFPVASGGGTVEVYPGRDLIVTAYNVTAAGVIVYEGFVTRVNVTAGATTNVGTIQTSAPVVKPENASCQSCHETTRDSAGQNLVIDYKQSGHYTNLSPMSPKNGSTVPGCAGCHGTQHNDANPSASGRCNECHDPLNMFPSHKGNGTAILTTNCNTCHQSHNTTRFVRGNCISCHSVAQNAGAGYVQDNNGVRSITQEFTKWSHHVTGVALNDAHCAACHLEGTIKNGEVMLDNTKHMVDAKTHLRHADTDADMQWDPAAPNHSTMDTYCMSCHDANGATSAMSAQIQAYINNNGYAAPGKTASALNPFGDTISNRYDKMLRPAVVDVDGQFNTANASHHAVKGPKYSGRTRAAGARQIANPAAFDDNSTATLWGKRSTIYDSVNSITGVEETTNKAFNALYVPLENAGGEAAPRTGAASLGDDSTLHCGDCHTVGQWKAGTAQFFNLDGSVDATKTSPAIGAHGSNNEYLLRNSKGTDERHTQDAYLKGNAAGTVLNPFTGVAIPNGNIVVVNPNAAFLVCFNCHSYSRYGSIYNATGTTGPHAGEYDASGRCNGVGNTIPFNGYTTGTATDGTQFVSRFDGPNSRYSTTPAFAPGFPLNYANAPGGAQAATYTGEQNPDFGNIFGIQCNNCHNSGVENGYGGIHGSKVSTYVDGMGNTQSMRRFLPGLGNTKYVPGTMGGITGGTLAGPAFNSRNSAGFQNYSYVTGGVSNDTNWEQVKSQFGPKGNQYAGAGCYTLSPNATAATYNQKGLSADGGATIPNAFGTWGGCDDHGAAQGAGDHGVIKRINRPITY